MEGTLIDMKPSFSCYGGGRQLEVAEVPAMRAIAAVAMTVEPPAVVLIERGYSGVLKPVLLEKNTGNRLAGVSRSIEGTMMNIEPSF